MRSLGRSDVLGWGGFVGAAGGLVSLLMLAGCPGTLDLAQFQSGSGGSTGTGGSNATGGATGTGGAAADCTGGNDGASIVTNNCARSGCHDSASAQFSASLDLTVNATIGSRLVGVMAAEPTALNMASCTSEQEPLLMAGPGQATGLLVDKIGPNFPCGGRMPLDSVAPLSTTQQNCVIQWATTLTSQ
jgi:hypothetical protein